MSTTWFMIRPVIGLSLLAAPASALTCSEYERIGRDAVDRVREDTACHDMSSDAWSSCMTAAFLAGEPSVVAFMEMTIAALEAKAQELQERLTEERFLWILACVVLFDVLAFIQMDNWAGAIVIGVIQLIGLVVLGDKLKVNVVMPLIDRLAGYLPKPKSD